VDQKPKRKQIAITTPLRRENALQLVKSESASLAGWASDVLAARQALDGAKTMDPVAQQNDPVLAEITSCSRFLNAMLVSGALAAMGVVIRIGACWYSWIHSDTSTRCNRVVRNDSWPQSPVRGSSPERAKTSR
jgi:hypothetical protein